MCFFLRCLASCRSFVASFTLNDVMEARRTIQPCSHHELRSPQQHEIIRSRGWIPRRKRLSVTALAVFAIYLLGLFLAFYSHPGFALFSYLWIFYNHPPAYWWGADLPDLRYSLFAAVAAFFAALSIKTQRTAPWFSNAGAKLITAYAVWMWIQVPWAIDSSVHVEGAILFTKYVILFYIIYKIASDEKTMEGFFWAHIAGCFLFGWVAYTSHVTGRLETVGGPGVDDANLLAAHMITGLGVAGFMFMGLKGHRRWAAFFPIPFILNGIILTQSRGAFLALLASAPVAWYLSPRTHRRFVLIAIVLGGVLFLSLSNEEFWERTSTIFGAGDSQSQETRVHIIGPQFQMFLDYPLGAGHRGNEFLSPKYIPEEFMSNAGRRSAHNTFMAVLVDQGLPGALILTGLYVWVGVSLRRLKRLDKQGLPMLLGDYRAAVGTALVSCFVSGLFLNMLKTEVQIWFLALLASLIARSELAVADRQTSATAATNRPAPIAGN